MPSLPARAPAGVTAMQRYRGSSHQQLTFQTSLPSTMISCRSLALRVTGVCAAILPVFGETALGAEPAGGIRKYTVFLDQPSCSATAGACAATLATWASSTPGIAHQRPLRSALLRSKMSSSAGKLCSPNLHGSHHCSSAASHRIILEHGLLGLCGACGTTVLQLTTLFASVTDSGGCVFRVCRDSDAESSGAEDVALIGADEPGGESDDAADSAGYGSGSGSDPGAAQSAESSEDDDDEDAAADDADAAVARMMAAAAGQAQLPAQRLRAGDRTAAAAAGSKAAADTNGVADSSDNEDDDMRQSSPEPGARKLMFNAWPDCFGHVVAPEAGC